LVLELQRSLHAIRPSANDDEPTVLVQLKQRIMLYWQARVRPLASRMVNAMSDIVFQPNHAGYNDIPEARLDDFLGCCEQGVTDDWTCKKTARKGDLYLFWFGSPAMRIAGVGVCKGDVNVQENEGVDWTNAPKLWACSFEPLNGLKRPVTLDHIKEDSVLASWWESQPWRGRSKSIPEKVAPRLLSLIRRLNPRLATLLAKYHSSAASIPSVQIPDDDDEPPATVHYVTSRKVRNTAKGEALKLLYKCKCQVCRYRIRVPRAGSGGYVEVHHLWPLGGKHRGRDNWDNMLVLCPNCHAEFDALAMAIDSKTRRITCYDGRNPKSGKEVSYRPGHSLASDNVEYQWKRFSAAKARAAQLA
jgi:5-methylcytosine-specific restriction endonuclease McrA